MLYVIHHRDYSGAEIYAAPVMRHDSDPLLACPPGSRSESWARTQGIPTTPLPFRELRHSGGALETVRSVARGLAGARDLRRIIRAHPERRILYCTSLRPALLAALAALGLRRHAVWAITDFMPPWPLRTVARLLARATCRRALALSEVAAADFTGRSRALRTRTELVYPGLDPTRFGDSGNPRDEPRAAVVGHISPTKRTDLAVEVAALVAESVPDFELRIVGRAQFREEDFALERALRARVAADPRLRRQVVFTGHTVDVSQELAACRLLLHCRADEPFGIVLIEAMASGLPVVAPAAAGPVEIVQDGVTGLLYEPGDAEHAARHVIRLARDAEEARRMGAAARARVAALFSERAQLATVDRVLSAL